MILEQSLKNLYSRVTTALPTVPVSLGMRRAGAETPAIVYELVSAEMDATISGGLTMFRASVAFHCVADLGTDSVGLVDDVITAISGTTTSNAIQTVLVSLSVNSQTATPDDGQGDAERITSVIAVFLFRRTT